MAEERRLEGALEREAEEEESEEDEAIVCQWCGRSDFATTAQGYVQE